VRFGVCCLTWLAVLVLQGMAKLPEVQAAMTRHFRSQVDRAGLGLELLPGVQKLLETLKVPPTPTKTHRTSMCTHALQQLQKITLLVELGRCVARICTVCLQGRVNAWPIAVQFTANSLQP